MDKIKIIISDDHKVVRTGIRLLFKKEKDIEIIGEAQDGREALEMVKENPPNVLITDITMPEMSGIELTKIITKTHPEVAVLILSMHDDDEYILDALKAGARGYLPKDVDEAEIILATRTLVSGKMYYSSSVSDVFAKSLLERNATKKEQEPLTDREKEVLALIVAGNSNKEIANMLFVSTRTVDAHRRNLMSKLKAKNTADIVRVAFMKKLIKL